MGDNGWMVKPTAVVVAGVTTGSAYSAYDAVGSSFTIPLAAGNRGAALYDLTIIDRGTANAALDLMMFSTAFSASPNGATFQIADADEKYFLGSASLGAGGWVTAGTAKNAQTISNPGIGIYAEGAARTLYCQLRTPGTPTWGDSANPLMIIPKFIQD